MIEPELLNPAPRDVRLEHFSGEAGPPVMQLLLGGLIVPVWWGTYAIVESSGFNLNAILFALGALGLTIFVEYKIWQAPIIHRRLVSNGLPVQGRVLGMQKVSGARPYGYAGIAYDVTFEYPGKNGAVQHTVRACAKRCDDLQVGQPLTILYDPVTGDDVAYLFSWYRAVG